MNIRKKKYDIAIVMPVYNEAECIADVVTSWIDTLSSLDMRFLILLFNDGSTDGTFKVLKQFNNHQGVCVVHQKNSGHGPTILKGYQMAQELSDWVFQCDSDDEMKALYFPELWWRRMDYDALFGIRHNRLQSAGRKLISALSRVTIKLLFGKRVSDVNVPYRLIKAEILKKAIANIPNDIFAPNIIISGIIVKQGCKIYEKAIPHEHRKTGRVSLVQFKLWKMAFKSFVQTVHVRFSAL